MTTPPSAYPIRVMLLDDHPLVLSGFSVLMKKHDDIAIVGSFTASDGLIAALRETQPDIILLDYALHRDDIDCLSLIRVLKKRFPAIRLLVMSSFHKPAIVALLMCYGADGFVGKEQSVDEVLLAIRSLMAGRSYPSQGMSASLDIGNKSDVAPLPADLPENADPQTLFSTLSEREQEVLRCYLQGLSVTEIAHKLNRSIKTISSQKISAFKKLGVKNGQELFKYHFQRYDQ